MCGDSDINDGHLIARSEFRFEVMEGLWPLDESGALGGNKT